MKKKAYASDDNGWADRVSACHLIVTSVQSGYCTSV